MNLHRMSVGAALLAGGATHAGEAAGLFQQVELSSDAQGKLVVDFDARVGVVVESGGVASWAGLDGNGAIVVQAVVGGAGPAVNITADGQRLVFTESNSANDRHLRTVLPHPGGGTWTIFMVGAFSSSNPNGVQDVGVYAFNLHDGAGNRPGINLQRDNGDADSFRAEIFTGGGTTYAYGPIDQYEDTVTVFRSQHTSSPPTSRAFGNGRQIGVTANATRDLAANPALIIGAFDEGVTFNGTGFTFLGEIRRLVVFDGLLCAADLSALETYLGASPDNPCPGDADGDADVDFGDLNAVLAAFNASPADLRYLAWADFNADCAVDFQDLNIALGSYSQPCPN